MFRGGWFRRVSGQGLERPRQNEAFEFCRLLTLPSESVAGFRGRGGGPGNLAITSIISRDWLRVEDVGNETRGFNASGPAKFHSLFKTSDDRRGKDILGTLLPGGERTTRLRFLAEDQADENVETAEREKEEGGDEGETVDVMRENCGPDPIVIQDQIRTDH